MDPVMQNAIYSGLALLLALVGFFARQSFEGMKAALDGLRGDVVAMKEQINSGDKAQALLDQRMKHLEEQMSQLREEFHALRRGRGGSDE